MTNDDDDDDDDDEKGEEMLFVYKVQGTVRWCLSANL